MGPSIDRFAILATYEPSELTRFLAMTPVLEQVAYHRNTERGFALPGFRAMPLSSIGDLARMADNPVGLGALVEGLDRESMQLAVLAAWHGGVITRDQAEREVTAARGSDDDVNEVLVSLEAAADRLRFVLVAYPKSFSSNLGELVRLRPDVIAHLQVPGVRLVDRLVHTNSDTIAGWLRFNQVENVPSRKDERTDELLRLFRDAARLGSIVQSLSGPASAMLQLLIEDIRPVPMEHVGLNYYAQSSIQQNRPGNPGAEAFSELLSHGLVGIDTNQRVAWTWQEISRTLRDGLFSRWTFAAKPTLITLPGEGRTEVIRTTETFDAVVRYWMKNPPSALSDGSIGVASIKAAAKKLKLDPGVVGLFTCLGVASGALQISMTGTTGRGRYRAPVLVWTAINPEDDGESVGIRWQNLVARWLSSESIDESDGLPTRYRHGAYDGLSAERGFVLRLLETLSPGMGAVDRPSLVNWIAEQHFHLLHPGIVNGILDGLQALGLVPGLLPFGLTDVARDLLEGRVVEFATSTDSSARLIVQGDHTVIAPPDTPGEVIVQLARFATLESDAGARLYRITESDVGSAIDDGLDVETILERLAEWSVNALPQSVSYFLRDVERRRGRLVVASATTVLSSSDPALLIEATRVKAAKLQLVSPNTAISELPAAKVHQALAAKGLLPVMFTQPAELEKQLASTARRSASGSPPKVVWPYLSRTQLEVRLGKLTA